MQKVSLSSADNATIAGFISSNVVDDLIQESLLRHKPVVISRLIKLAMFVSPFYQPKPTMKLLMLAMQVGSLLTDGQKSEIEQPLPLSLQENLSRELLELATTLYRNSVGQQNQPAGKEYISLINDIFYAINVIFDKAVTTMSVRDTYYSQFAELRSAISTKLYILREQ